MPRIRSIFRFVKRLFLLGVLGVALCAAGIWLGDAAVEHAAVGRCYKQVDELPANRVALVLGASSHTRRGNTNLYFKYRMEAAALLWKEGKVQHLLLSGDNHTKGYDEPTAMRDYLLQLGVPSSAMTLDYAGFRTLDSVVRAKKVFGQTEFTVVSQQFHNERALFLCEQNGIEAVAYNAKDVPRRYHRYGMVREALARTKAVLDVYVLKTDPKFLGEPVTI